MKQVEQQHTFIIQYIGVAKRQETRVMKTNNNTTIFSHANQYIRIRHLLTTNSDFEQFQSRLQNSPINSNRYYLGLLLMAILSVPAQKVNYIRTLIKYGADINFCQPIIPQTQQSTQTHGRTNIRTLQTDCNPNLGKSVLMIACQKSVATNVKYLLGYENLQVGYLDACGNSALDYAIRNNSQQQAILIIRDLVKQFPHLLQPTSPSPQNQLFQCIQLCKLQILEHLLQAYPYISPNLRTQPTGQTALHYAISLSGVHSELVLREVVTILLRYRADPEIEDYLGSNAYDYGEKYLVDVREIVSKVLPEVAQRNDGKDNANKCFTVCTYADSRTVMSKDSDTYQFIEDLDVVNHNQQIVRDDGQVYQYIQIKEITQKQEEIVVEIRQQEQKTEQQCQQIGQKLCTPMPSSYTLFHNTLSTQIHNLCTKCTLIHEQAHQDICQLLRYLKNLGKKLQLNLQIIGSFATGLWTQFSDIDVVYINQRTGYFDIAGVLGRVYEALWSSRGSLGVQQIYVNKDQKFPNIKLKLSSKYNDRRIQIVIFQKNCLARKYVHYITQYLQKYPIVKPLYFTFHKLLQSFQLHRPTKNGIKSYTLFLMIVTAVEWYCHYYYEYYYKNMNGGIGEDNYNCDDQYLTEQYRFGVYLEMFGHGRVVAVSELFLQVLRYYNHYYQYQYAKNMDLHSPDPLKCLDKLSIIPTQLQLYQQPPLQAVKPMISELSRPCPTSNTYKPVLNIIDPLNYSNNTGGKQTNTERLIAMFRSLQQAVFICMENYGQEDQNGDQEGDESGGQIDQGNVLQYLLQIHRMFV